MERNSAEIARLNANLGQLLKSERCAVPLHLPLSVISCSPLSCSQKIHNPAGMGGFALEFPKGFLTDFGRRCCPLQNVRVWRIVEDHCSAKACERRFLLPAASPAGGIIHYFRKIVFNYSC